MSSNCLKQNRKQISYKKFERASFFVNPVLCNYNHFERVEIHIKNRKAMQVIVLQRNQIFGILRARNYDILVLTDLETICDICLKFSLFLHYFCALLNKELSSGNSICQNLPHGHDIGKLDFILTLQAYFI